ncbi:TIGR03089 family protein [Jannaschia sp. R86511]|uniref:TIGR03089 family protein n=1 Tax=Jannaschia sp. R86511 TaxID=3093853 RepID=UPI0036D3769F
MQIGAPPPSSSPGPAAVDVARLVASLQADPRPRLTWYGEGGSRVELTGRVLAQWVAKTAHLLAEEADVVPGSRVAVRLGADWRAPVLRLAAWYLGAQVDEASDDDDRTPDVVVVREDDADREARAGAVVVVVAAAALPGPVRDLPAGAVDYGAEVSAQPDQPPAPGPATVLRLALTDARRVLLGPERPPQHAVAVWAGGGSVVLHTGLDPQALQRVAAQENVDPDVDQPDVDQPDVDR